MTVTVSISHFRQNIAEYLLLARAGTTIILKDGKKKEEIARILSGRKFQPEIFGKTLESAKDLFTLANHPEWKSRNDVANWLEASRKDSDRTL